MVRYALLALVLVTSSTPALAARQDAAEPPGSQAPAPAAPDSKKSPTDLPVSTSALTRAVEDGRRQGPATARPSPWVSTFATPSMRTWIPGPQWERMWLTTPEEFRGGLLYTGGMSVYPWPRIEWLPGQPLGAKVSTQPATRPARD